MGAAAAKSKKKRRPPERSEIILDVKPFDDQTDLEALAVKIKATTLESLRDKEFPGPNEDGDTWDFLEKEAQKVDERITLESAHKWGTNHHLEEIGYGIKKLRIQCVVENELVGSDLLLLSSKRLGQMTCRVWMLLVFRKCNSLNTTVLEK